MSPSQTLQQPDYYTILGADPMAQLDKIESLFRELAIEAETTGDHSKVPQAVEAFKVLRDPQLRQRYDQVLSHQRAQLHEQQMSQLTEVQTEQTQATQPQLTQPQSVEPQAVQPPSVQPQATQSLATQIQEPQSYEPQPTHQTERPVQPTLHEQPAELEANSTQPVQVAEMLQPPVEQNELDVMSGSELSPAAEERSLEPAAAAVVTVEPVQEEQEEQELAEPAEPEHTPENKSTPTEELKLKPDVLERHRRELLRMFYEKRRANMRASGIAIGGIDTVVAYSYELLEFHLWVLAEKKWIVREESGALAISAKGCECHEKNLTEGLIVSSLG